MSRTGKWESGDVTRDAVSLRPPPLKKQTRQRGGLRPHHRERLLQQLLHTSLGSEWPCPCGNAGRETTPTLSGNSGGLGFHGEGCSLVRLRWPDRFDRFSPFCTNDEICHRTRDMHSTGTVHKFNVSQGQTRAYLAAPPRGFPNPLRACLAAPPCGRPNLFVCGNPLHLHLKAGEKIECHGQENGRVGMLREMQ